MRVQSGPRTERSHASTSPDRVRRRQWAHNAVDLLVFLLGMGIFLYPLIASYVNYQESSSHVDSYDAIVAGLSPQQKRKMWEDAKQYNRELGIPSLRDPFKYKTVAPPLNRYYKILNVDGKGMMAYIDIPKISVKVPLYHNTSDQVLTNATGHIPTTHLPTDNRTVHSVVTGHTGEVGHIIFDNLTQMRVGDVFQMRVLDHHMSYRVDQIKIILPNEVDSLQPVNGINYVTLLTCYPYGINSHRLLVRGRYIGDNIPSTQPTGAPRWMLWVLLALFVLSAAGLWQVSKKRREYRTRPAVAAEGPLAHDRSGTADDEAVGSDQAVPQNSVDSGDTSLPGPSLPRDSPG